VQLFRVGGLWCFAEGFGENEGEQRGVGWSIATASDGREDVERTDSLVATLHGVTLAYLTEGSVEQRLSAIGELIEPDSDRILEQCEAHQATAGRKYLPFLTRFYSHQRAALYNFLESVELLSTSPDKSMTDAIAYLIAHRKSRQDRLPIRAGEEAALSLDLSFVGEPW